MSLSPYQLRNPSQASHLKTCLIPHSCPHFSLFWRFLLDGSPDISGPQAGISAPDRIFPVLRPDISGLSGSGWILRGRGGLLPPRQFHNPPSRSLCIVLPPWFASIHSHLPEALRPRIFLALGQICIPSAWGSILSTCFPPWTLVMYSIFESRTKSISLFLAVLECFFQFPLVETLALACTSHSPAAIHV